jgi:hypothetical protein
MKESKIEVTFKSSHLSFPIFLRILKFTGNISFNKIKSEKNRVIIYSNLASAEKLAALRKLFGFLNFYEILTVETTY